MNDSTETFCTSGIISIEEVRKLELEAYNRNKQAIANYEKFHIDNPEIVSEIKVTVNKSRQFSRIITQLVYNLQLKIIDMEISRGWFKETINVQVIGPTSKIKVYEQQMREYFDWCN